MFLFLGLGASLPVLLGDFPPPVGVIVYLLIGGELIYETMRPVGCEADETLAGPAKILALALVAGGTAGMLWSYHEPIRRSASLLLVSGVCLFWGYRHGRLSSPWLLAGPALIVTAFMILLSVFDVSWTSRYVPAGWLLMTALLPAALAWSLLAVSDHWTVLMWFLIGIASLLFLFLFADPVAMIAFVIVAALGLWAVRQDPDVPFFFNGLCLFVSLIVGLLGLLPFATAAFRIPFPLRSASARFLLGVQAQIEQIVGAHVWEQLWSIPRRIPRTELGPAAWWSELLKAQQVELGMLGFLLAAALIAVLFLVSTVSRRSRDRTSPTLWRVLGIAGWLTVGFLTPLWLIAPFLWFLIGGVLALKEATPQQPTERQPDLPLLSAYLPAVMAALIVIPVFQSSREWRAESLYRGSGDLVRAAKWAPWRADIAQAALIRQLERPLTERDSELIDYLLELLRHSNRKAAAYRAESSLNSAGGSPALVSLAWAVRSAPHDLETRREYADALRASGVLEEARRQYEICADLAPMDPSLRIAIASLWELQRDEEMALNEYRKALTLDPSSEIARLKVKELSNRAVP